MSPLFPECLSQASWRMKIGNASNANVNIRKCRNKNKKFLQMAAKCCFAIAWTLEKFTNFVQKQLKKIHKNIFKVLNTVSYRIFNQKSCWSFGFSYLKLLCLLRCSQTKIQWSCRGLQCYFFSFENRIKFCKVNKNQPHNRKRKQNQEQRLADWLGNLLHRESVFKFLRHHLPRWFLFYFRFFFCVKLARFTNNNKRASETFLLIFRFPRTYLNTK